MLNSMIWLAFEIDFTSDYEYTDTVYTVDMDVVFMSENGTKLIIPAFWCGGKSWKVRVALTEIGKWTYQTICTDSANNGLNGIKGEVICGEYTGNLEIYKRGFIKTLKGTRYFMYADGTPFFYLGDTHWTMPLEEFDGIGKIDEETAEKYGVKSQFRHTIDYRAEQGFTVIQSQTLSWYTPALGNSWLGDSTGTIYKHGIDQVILDQFEILDKYFEYVAKKGLVHAHSQFSYPEELIKAYFAEVITKDKLEKLCRYWVARYSAYPVMWTTTQEGDNDYYGFGGCTTENNPWIYVIDFIDKYDPYNHPSTCHQENALNTIVKNSNFGVKDSHDWYAAQYTFDVCADRKLPFDVLKEYYNNEGSKPVINYEGRYDHFVVGNLVSRAQGWGAYLNGCFGFGYGSQPIWSISWANMASVGTVKDEYESFERDHNWINGLYSEASKQLIVMKNYLSKFDWWNLTPCFDDGEYYVNDATNFMAAHINDRFFIAYLYNACGKFGSFKNMKNGTYEAVWLNCTTGGEIKKTIDVTNNSFDLYSIDNADDWAISLKYIG